MIERVVSGPNWRLKALLAIAALSLLRAFPSYDALATKFVEETWRDVQIKFEHPLLDTSKAFSPDAHQSNLTFRLVVPMLAHIFRLHERGLLILSAFAGLLLLYQILAIVYNATSSRRAAFLICLATACVWPGEAAYHELRGGYYDAITICLSVCAFATSSPAGAFAFLFLAAWTDERGLIAAPFLFLLSVFNGARFYQGKAGAAIAAATAYLCTRAYLTTAHSYPVRPTAALEFQILSQQVNVIPLAIWSGLSGSWIIVALGVAALFLQRRLNAGLFAATLIATITISLTVVDVTRSMAFCLPAVFVAVAALSRTESLQRVERIAALAAIISFVVPTFYLEGATGVWWLYPLPIQIVRWFLVVVSRSS